MHDVIIIGGSFAGLAAATQLGRARRDTLVLDTGLPRNRFSPAAHGILGHDGVPPREILAKARAQLLAYPKVRIHEGEAVAATGKLDDFAVTLASGESLQARRLILAHGVTDTLPDVPGLWECWGRTVLHCPYCHGYEVADRKLGALVPPQFLGHVAPLYAEWSQDLTLFSNGQPVDDETRAGLKKPLIETPVARIEHEGDQIRAVILADGHRVPIDALFVPPSTKPSSPIAASLGCEFAEAHNGPYVVVDPMQRTSVEGVYAAGDITRGMHNASFALADGVGAGTASHQSLL